VRERREAATPIVRSFGGRPVKTTGDGGLLEFPSVVAAAECAISIQKMMAERNATVPEAKRILYRVGAHRRRRHSRRQRRRAVCEPGGVCLSSSAHEQVRGRIEADFLDLSERAMRLSPATRMFRFFTS
jgi:class 3 adenylate cyclase